MSGLMAHKWYEFPPGSGEERCSVCGMDEESAPLECSGPRKIDAAISPSPSSAPRDATVEAAVKAMHLAVGVAMKFEHVRRHAKSAAEVTAEADRSLALEAEAERLIRALAAPASPQPAAPETHPADPGRVARMARALMDRHDFWNALRREDRALPGEYDDLADALAASPREDPPGALREASRRLLLIVPHFVSTQADPRYHTVAGEVIDTKHEACPACAVRDALASPPSPSDTTSPVNSPEGDTKETKP